MGMYLNGTEPYTLYKKVVDSPYFVDKSKILIELFSLINQDSNYVCITRPRRFGKTVMANMIGSFFTKGVDSGSVFEQLDIVKSDLYKQHLNQYHVIFISLNILPKRCKSYDQYIERIENALINDLQMVYPTCKISKDDAVWDAFMKVFSATGDKFFFIFDEWDAIFHRDFVTKKDKEDYVAFFSMLLKDQAYVSLAYMTGILPIAKYSSGSELNMFIEFTMAKSPSFSDYYGFTESEVDDLYSKYIELCKEPTISRDALREWYDGYHTAVGERVYNPRSVVHALRFNHLANYWTSSGPYDEIFYYIQNNVADVRDYLALMVAGETVPSKVEEYAATAMNLNTRDEIFSAMVVYGFLSFENGRVSIPNKELMDKFSYMLQKEDKLGYVNQLARESERMLAATLARDTDTMTQILSYAHDSEIPLYQYNHETELSAIVNLIYLAARDRYDVQREDKSGIGYVDFIFYPKTKSDDCIIIELKVDHTPEEAIQQIKNRKYILRFKGKLGEVPMYTGRVLAVGIGYDKKTKKHECRVEVLKINKEEWESK